MKLLDDYFKMQKKIYKYFGYNEDWAVIPLNDCRDYYWVLLPDSVRFSETLDFLHDTYKRKYYEYDIYYQRHLPKHVYVGKNYTMICVDTHTDGNKFISVFDNSKKETEI